MAGKATGAATIAPPTAAKTIPMVRMVLKNFDVGATNLCACDYLHYTAETV
jgi:hypothetical protein